MYRCVAGPGAWTIKKPQSAWSSWYFELLLQGRPVCSRSVPGCRRLCTPKMAVLRVPTPDLSLHGSCLLSLPLLATAYSHTPQLGDIESSGTRQDGKAWSWLRVTASSQEAETATQIAMVSDLSQHHMWCISRSPQSHHMWWGPGPDMLTPCVVDA